MEKLQAMQNLLTFPPQTPRSRTWNKGLKDDKHAADPFIGVSVPDISYQGNSS